MVICGWDGRHTPTRPLVVQAMERGGTSQDESIS